MEVLLPFQSSDSFLLINTSFAINANGLLTVILQCVSTFDENRNAHTQSLNLP